MEQKNIRIRKHALAERLNERKNNKETENNDKVTPITLKILTERRLTGSDDIAIPNPPAGMCIDFDMLAEDESGEEATVLITGDMNCAVEEKNEINNKKTFSPDRTEMVTSGEMICDDNRTELRWQEFIPSGFVDCSISFMNDMPEVLTFIRTRKMTFEMMLDLPSLEDEKLTFVLEEGRRHTCLHRNEGDTDIFVVRTFRLCNSLFKRGALLFEYSVEIRGIRVERTKIAVKIKNYPLH